jgi:hypothetical protein
MQFFSGQSDHQSMERVPETTSLGCNMNVP